MSDARARTRGLTSSTRSRSELASTALNAIASIDRDHTRHGRTQFASLEGLRVVASLMIVVFHAHSISLRHAIAQGVPYFEAPVAWYSCIELFFTMSGFLMIHMSRSLYGGAAGVRNFTLRRITRTPPLYYIYTLGLFAVFSWKPTLSSQGPVDWAQLIGSLSFFPMTRPPIIAIGWTLQFEVFFYILIGLSIFLPFRWGWKAVVAILSGLVLVGQTFGLRQEPLATWTDPKMLDFVIGILVAVAYHRGATLSTVGRWMASIAGLMLILSLHHLYVSRDMPRVVFLGLGMGLILAAATLSEHQWRFGRLQPIVHNLSNQTYTMYLCHIVLLKIFEVEFFKYFSGPVADVSFILLGSIMVVVVCRGLYLVGEKPLTHYLRGVLARAKAPRQAIA